MKTIIISFEEWKDFYKPILNPFNEIKSEVDDEDYEIGFSTLEENDLIKDNLGQNKIWTMITGDRDSVYLTTGYRRVNRVNHFITQVPYEEEIEIQIIQGYPKITHEDLDNLEKKIDYERDEGILESLKKIHEFVMRTNH